MEIIKVFLLAILFCIVGSLVKSHKSEYFLLFELSSLIVLGFFIVSSTDEIITQIEEFAFVSNDVSPYIKLLLKALAISVLTDFGVSFCLDSANMALSKIVDLTGKTAILALSLPLLKRFVESVIEFLR